MRWQKVQKLDSQDTNVNSNKPETIKRNLNDDNTNHKVHFTTITTEDAGSCTRLIHTTMDTRCNAVATLRDHQFIRQLLTPAP